MSGTILLCALLTAALLLLACLVLAWLLLPLRPGRCVCLLFGEGDGAELEQACRACLFLRGLGLLRQPLVVVDLGLNEAGRRLAEALTKLDDSILLLSCAELTAYLARRKANAQTE